MSLFSSYHLTIQHEIEVSEFIPCRKTCCFLISAVYPMHLSDREDFGTILSLAGFINIEQGLWFDSKGLRISLDLGGI